MPAVHFLLLLLLAVIGRTLIHLMLSPAGRLRPAGPGLFRCNLESPESIVPAVTRTSPSPPAVPGQGEVILVVDDESGVRELLKAILLRHGYQVLTAADAREGLRIFQAERARVALVISDLQMPQAEGGSFAELLRSAAPGVRILFMSGLDHHEGSREIRPADSGVPFLLKPFRAATLLQEVDQLLHPAAGPRT